VNSKDANASTLISVTTARYLLQKEEAQNGGKKSEGAMGENNISNGREAKNLIACEQTKKKQKTH